MNLTNQEAESFFEKASQWEKEYLKLREIVKSTNLTEEFKWKHPCYSLNKNNVVLIHGFKDYCALLFMKGALLKDSENVLIQQTKNVQAQRQIRFSSLEQINQMKWVIKTYIEQAIEVEKTGLKVKLKKEKDFHLTEEFQRKIDSSPALKVAFDQLTPGRKRAYLLYFSAPKLSKTRESRVEKYISKILDGLGLDD